MYRIGELAKMAEVTPDTIRYYEKQQMMEHEVRTEGGFRLYTESDLQRLKFIRHARQLGFSLESIRELLSIRIDPEHHTCQESKGIVQERLQEVEARIPGCSGVPVSQSSASAVRCKKALICRLFSSGNTEQVA